jgi:hypothetical protein
MNVPSSTSPRATEAGSERAEIVGTEKLGALAHAASSGASVASGANAFGTIGR